MRKVICLAVVCVMAAGGVLVADTFGTGDNQFTIDFVNISGDAGNLGSWSAVSDYTFSGVNHGDYRMGTYEITNAQWTKFKAAYGDVKGTPTNAYDENSYWTIANVPTNEVSWYEAAQFVNWLNTSSGKSAAYKFTGDIHTSNYTLGVWDSGDADGTNLYRNKNAKYFLPTENEWVKAAYWNGTTLQTYATKAGESLYQGNGSNGGWNYFYPYDPWALPHNPWAVGSGSEELNGTYDMMGNVGEWMESPYATGNYISSSTRGVRGGSCYGNDNSLASSVRYFVYPKDEYDSVGFRVASIPEPCTLLLLGLGGIIARRGRRN